MDSAVTVFLLRLIHILFGVFWVGAVIFVSAFLLPSLRAVGPARRGCDGATGSGQKDADLPDELGHPHRPVRHRALLARLGRLQRRLDAQRTGQGIRRGRGAGHLAAAVGVALTSPAGKRMGMLAAEMRSAGGPPRPELLAQMQVLQAKIARSSSVVVALLVLAVCAMAIARYVP